ncbi:MAG TPA: hypothetical protein PKW35_00300 [Nannocystaceae bacterium]|nr:hypothetical protein [Nannocystaceae bacterium]
MRPAGAPLLLTACLVENPSYHGDSGTGASTRATTGALDSSASASAGATASGGAGSEGATGTGSAATSDATTAGSTAPTPETTDASTSTGVEGTSTAGPAFEPMMLRHYTPGTCDKGPHCMSGGTPVPAFIQAFECFTAPAAPFLLTRVGAEVRYVVGKPAGTLRVYAFDPVAHLPILPPVAERALGVVDTPMTYRDFPLDPPIGVDALDFCVSIEGGNGQSTLVLFTETSTVDPADAFVTIDDPGNDCDTTMVNLKQWYMLPSAHYCIDVSVAPP